MDFELGEITPILHPLVDQPAICGFHDLIATRQVRRDPTRDVGQSLGRHPSAFAKAPVYGHRVAEMLDHHVQAHSAMPSFFSRARTRSASSGDSPSPHFCPIIMLSVMRPGIALIALRPRSVE